MPFREIILNNFWWKVTALLLAIGAWYGFKTPADLPSLNLRTGYSTRELVGHPITISKPASDNREFKVTPSEVDITISGDLAVLKKLAGTDVRATVDLTDIRNATSSVPIRVVVPDGRGLQLEKLNPERVQVELLKP